MASKSLPTELRLSRLERRVDELERAVQRSGIRSIDALMDQATVRHDRVADAGAYEVASAPEQAEELIPLAPVFSTISAPLQNSAASSRVEPAADAAPPPLPVHEPAAARNPATKLHVPAYARPSSAPAIPEPRAPRALEQTIGLKWAGWIGAIVLVIGAALGVKYAYDNHWFGHLAPSIKLGLIVAAGFGLIGAGEVVFRRIHKIPAASMFGAGVATLFIAAYVGHQYELYSATSAQIAMTIATLIGAAVAMRGNLVSIAVLSLIGGNVAPLIVGDPNTSLPLFLTYVLMLQLVALALAAWGRGGKWWTLRGLSLATTSFWISAKLVAPPTAHEPILLGAMIASALLYHIELITTAWRRTDGASSIAFSLCATAALTVGVLHFQLDATRAVRGASVIAIAISSGVIGFALPQLRASLANLAISYRSAAAALIVLAVPVGVGGPTILIGWMILGLAFALTGRFAKSRIASIASTATWLLAVMRLGSIVVGHFDDPNRIAHLEPIWLTLFNTTVASTAILGWLLALLGHANVRLSRGHDRGSLATLSILATIVWCGVSLAYLPPLGASAAILVGAWLLMTVGHAIDATRTNLVQSTAILMLVTIKWALIDALATRLSPNWSANQYLPVLNPLMLTGGAIAASLAGLYFLRGDALRRELNCNSTNPRSPGIMLALVAAIIAVVTIGFSFEIDRMVERAALVHPLHMSLAQLKHLSWTMLWSAAWCGLAMAGVKILDGDHRRRWIGILWLVPALLVMKYIVIDTIFTRTPGARITPMLNLHSITGVVIVASLALTRRLAVSAHDRMRGQLAMLALFVIAWMGTLEISRAVAWYAMTPTFHVKQLCWTAWWMTCAAGAFAIGRRFDRDAAVSASWHRALPRIATIVTLKYLLFDTIAWHALKSPAPWPIIVNIEAMTAAIVIAGLLVIRFLGLPDSAAVREPALRARSSMLAVLVLLWAGSIEIDRAFFLPAIRASLSDPRLAEQVAMSIYWSLFGVATVVFGFIFRTAHLRYFGLTLLALTLGKVFVIDMRGVESFYRILSFLGLGGLLLGVSVVYGKVSPKLLAEQTPGLTPAPTPQPVPLSR